MGRKGRATKKAWLKVAACYSTPLTQNEPNRARESLSLCNAEFFNKINVRGSSCFVMMRVNSEEAWNYKGLFGVEGRASHR